jgi:hypothetical protein
MNNTIITIKEEEQKICKYCYEDIDEEHNPIIYPCNCNDGVHLNCLAIWLNYKKNHVNVILDKCEICKGTYIDFQIDITPLPSPTSSNYSIENQEDEDDENNNDDHFHTAYFERRRNVIARIYIIDLDFICCECYSGEFILYLICFISSILFGLFFFSNQIHYDAKIKIIAPYFLLIALCSFSFSLFSTSLRICNRKITRNRRVRALNQ